MKAVRDNVHTVLRPLLRSTLVSFKRDRIAARAYLSVKQAKTRTIAQQQEQDREEQQDRQQQQQDTQALHLRQHKLARALHEIDTDESRVIELFLSNLTGLLSLSPNAAF